MELEEGYNRKTLRDGMIGMHDDRRVSLTVFADLRSAIFAPRD
jgi:hypothetical protein